MRVNNNKDKKMDDKLKNIKKYMLKEDKIYDNVIKTVKKFLVDNNDQKLTVWNGSSLIATLKTTMQDIINDKDEKENKSEV